MEGAKINKIHFRDSGLRHVDFDATNIGALNADKCEFLKPFFHRGFIAEFSLTNSTIEEARGKGFKADMVVWDNVTLDGKIDLTNAQVKDFRPSRLKRGPRLQLITTGSNMRIDLMSR